MQSKSRLVGLGSILVDEVFRVPHLPTRMGDVVASENYRVVGGGLNVLVAATRLGLSSAYLGAHGTGPNSDAIRSALNSEGIEILSLPREEKDSGSCLTLLEPDGTRTFVTAPGIESEPRLANLIETELQADDYVYISGYDLGYPIAGPVLGQFIDEYIREQKIIFDPGPLVADIPSPLLAEVLRRAEVTSCNISEYQYLLDAEFLTHVRRNLVVRNGSEGAAVITTAGPKQIPAPSVIAVDSTGAGDSHIGAMLSELAAGATLENAVYFANVCAAISVTRFGPAVGPTRSEVASSGLYET